MSQAWVAIGKLVDILCIEKARPTEDYPNEDIDIDEKAALKTQIQEKHLLFLNVERICEETIVDLILFDVSDIPGFQMDFYELEVKKMNKTYTYFRGKYLEAQANLNFMEELAVLQQCLDKMEANLVPMTKIIECLQNLLGLINSIAMYTQRLKNPSKFYSERTTIPIQSYAVEVMEEQQQLLQNDLQNLMPQSYFHSGNLKTFIQEQIEKRYENIGLLKNDPENMVTKKICKVQFITLKILLEKLSDLHHLDFKIITLIVENEHLLADPTTT